MAQTADLPKRSNLYSSPVPAVATRERNPRDRGLRLRIYMLCLSTMSLSIEGQLTVVSHRSDADQVHPV